MHIIFYLFSFINAKKLFNQLLLSLLLSRSYVFYNFLVIIKTISHFLITVGFLFVEEDDDLAVNFWAKKMTDVRQFSKHLDY